MSATLSQLLDQRRIPYIGGHFRWELMQPVALSTVEHTEVATSVPHAQPVLNLIEGVEADWLIDIFVICLIELIVSNELMICH